MEDKKIIEGLEKYGWDISQQALTMFKNLNINSKLIKELSDHVKKFKNIINGSDINSFLLRDRKEKIVYKKFKEGK